MLPECLSPRCLKDTDKVRRRSVESALQSVQQANQTLQDENCLLRNEVGHAEDKVHQLRHELSQKQMLMEIYHKEIEALERVNNGNSDIHLKTTVSTLEARVHELEHEKWELTLELESRKTELEERESKLDSLKQSYLKQIENLKSKVAKHKEAVRSHEERNANLQMEKEVLQGKLSTWHHVVDRVKIDLEIKDRQIEEFAKRENSILDEMKTRQEEIDNLRKLYEARRDEAKHLRMSSPTYGGRPRSYSAEDFSEHQCSLKEELEDSLRRQSGQMTPDFSPISSPISKVFETVRSANLLLNEMEHGHHCAGAKLNSPPQMERSSTYSIGGDSGCGDLGSDDENSPGSHCSRSPQLEQTRRRNLHLKKLQIIKPLEGSETLRQWQRLATPSLTTLLQPRHGVFSRHELDSEQGCRFDWPDQGLGLGEPEEDDDPDLDRTYNTEDSGYFPEIRQTLTEEFIQGISCYGVQSHQTEFHHEDLDDASEIRPRSNSLAERIQKSGIRARRIQKGSHFLSVDSLPNQASSNIASMFSSCPILPSRRNSVPAQLGLNANPHNSFGRQISTPTSHLRHPEPTTGFGVADLVTKHFLHFMEGLSTKAQNQTKESISTTTRNHVQGVPTPYTGPRLKLRQAVEKTGSAKNSASSNSSHRRNTKLKIKLVKNKKPEESVFQPLENQTDQGISVLHTITSLRRNNMLVGGLPEAATPSSPLTTYLDDITMGIFSA